MRSSWDSNLGLSPALTPLHHILGLLSASPALTPLHHISGLLSASPTLTPLHHILGLLSASPALTPLHHILGLLIASPALTYLELWHTTQLPKSVSDAIIEFLHYVCSLLDIKQSTIAVYLYFSKASDTVNHDILISKLLHNDIRGVMQSWIKSYFSNREKYVSIKNCSSSVNYYIGCSARFGVGPSTFFCISMACAYPQTRCVLFILLIIQQFLHLKGTLTMFMPQWMENWKELITDSRSTDFHWTLVKLNIW